MKVINLLFDTLKFVPVMNLSGDFFAFNSEFSTCSFHNLPEETIFPCYKITQDGNLTETVYCLKKNELKPVWVRVSFV